MRGTYNDKEKKKEKKKKAQEQVANVTKKPALVRMTMSLNLFKC